MVSDWQQVRLGEIVDFTPKRTIKKGTTAPFISMADVTENSKFITEVFEKEYTGGGSRFANGDTLFARITPCLQNGKCSKVSGMENTEIGHGSTEFIVMAAKTPEYDEDYIYYLARLPKFRAYAESRMIGSTGRQRVSWQDLEEYEFAAPPPNERKDIGSFLSSLDDKIELNRQMNETLEAMAQALFKSWFVDFDPVIDNALAAGNTIPDEFIERAEQRKAIEKKDNSEIQDLFPDTFEFTEEMGWIPKGWEAESFGDVSMCFDRLRVPLSKRERENKKPGIIPYHGATSVMDYINEWIFDDIYLLIGEDGSVIKEDGSPFVQYIWGKTWVNNHAHVLQGKNGVGTEHLMLFMQSQNLTAYITGAVQLKINQGNMNRIPFLNSGSKINEKFTAIINPYYEKVRITAEENETLTKLRDTLLPKLMSGELRIPDAAALVDEVL